MGEDASPRRRLAQLIEQRRRGLGLSVRGAAEAAGIDRATWTSAEGGTRQTAEYNYAGIERALSWKAGSIDSILAGGDPVNLPVASSTGSGRPRKAQTDLITQWEQQSIAEIKSADIPQVVKDELMAVVRTRAAEARIAEDRIRNATAS